MRESEHDANEWLSISKIIIVEEEEALAFKSIQHIVWWIVGMCILGFIFL